MSHVNMQVSPSGTDEKEILKRAETSGYNVALIHNKKGKIFCHIVDYDSGLYLSELDVEYYFPFSNEEYEAEKLTSVKEAETIEEVEEIMNFSEWDYMEEFYGLEQEELEFLEEEVVVKRFTNNSPVKYVRNKDWSEWGKKEEPKLKSLSSMTDEEFNAYYGYYD